MRSHTECFGEKGSVAVSIIIPAFNAAGFLRETIQSVIDQSLQEWEMIIVDDGSRDETLAIANGAAKKDFRIRVFTQSNRGQSAAQNLALSQASGDFILLLDADDLLAPNALERQYQNLQKSNDSVAVYGEFLYLSEDGGSITPASVFGDRIRPEGKVVEDLLVSNFLVAPGSVMFRRSVAMDVGGLREELVIGQDWEFWLRLAVHGHFEALKGDPIFFYRIRADSVSRRGGKRPYKYDVLRKALFTNPDILQRFPARRLRRLERLFKATVYASSGRDAIANARWTDAIRYYFVSAIHNPTKFSRWALLAVATLRWAPPSLATRIGLDDGHFDKRS